MRFTEYSPDNRQEVVRELVDIAERLNYKINIMTEAGVRRTVKYKEVVTVTREEIKLLIDGKPDAISLSEIVDIRAEF